MHARQFLGSTFERTVVYQRSMQPDAEARSIDVVLHAKGGTTGLLCIGADGSCSALTRRPPRPAERGLKVPAVSSRVQARSASVQPRQLGAPLPMCRRGQQLPPVR